MSYGQSQKGGCRKGRKKKRDAKKVGKRKRVRLHLDNPGAEEENLMQPRTKLPEKERSQWGKGITAYLMKTGLDWEHALIWVQMVQAWNQKNLGTRTQRDTYYIHMNTYLIWENDFKHNTK